MALVWENLTFEDRATWKTLLKFCCCFPLTDVPILNKLSGSVQSGQLIAIMGPSGAGKSTFFNLLTNGKTFGEVSGCIYVNSAISKGGLGKTSYLTQTAEDHLLPNLTVKESLLFASKLKNKHFTSNGDHKRVIRVLIKELNLTEIKHKSTELCSGGQKKRLAIGLELTAEDKPKFFILDEPLSGLDSCVGLEVVTLLQDFAKKHRMAIIVTIHQPSFEILNCFHQAYVISKLGQCIFNGPPTTMKTFLTKHQYKYGPDDNPADNLIKIASSVERGRDRLISPNTERDPECGNASSGLLQNICRQMATTVRQYEIERPSVTIKATKSGICQNSATFSFDALMTLFWRSAITSLLRQKKLILIRAALHVVVAGVLAGLYNRDIGTAAGCFIPKGFDPKNCSCIPTEDELRKETITTQNVKFQFFSLLFLMFAALMPTVLTIPTEIKLFLNEHRNGWYTTLSYYISKTIVEIPVQLFLSGSYTLFLYWYSAQIGLELEKWTFGWQFIHFLFVTWISCFIAQGLGFLIGTLFVYSFSMSVIASSSVLLFLFLFSGFFVKVVEMKPEVSWMTYISFIRFAFESLLITIFGFDRCDSSSSSSAGPMKQAPIVLFTFGLEDSDYYTNWAWLIGHLVVTRVLAFVALKAKAEPTFLSLKSGHSCIKGIMKVLTPIFKLLGKGLFAIFKVVMGIFLLILLISAFTMILQSIAGPSSKNSNKG